MGKPRSSSIEIWRSSEAPREAISGWSFTSTIHDRRSETRRRAATKDEVSIAERNMREPEIPPVVTGMRLEAIAPVAAVKKTDSGQGSALPE